MVQHRVIVSKNENDLKKVNNENEIISEKV